MYEKCFIHELRVKGLKTQSQQRIPINYKGLELDAELRYDVLVEDLIITELKAMEGILPIHEAVLLTYMKMLEKPKGIIINFNCTHFSNTVKKQWLTNFIRTFQKSDVYYVPMWFH